MPTRRHFLYLASASTLALRSALSQSPDTERMPPTASPAFDVATIRPSDPDSHRSGFHTSGRSIFIENWTPANMICFAYSVHAKQLGDAPPWITSDHFDTKGMPDLPGLPSLLQQRVMLQKLLTERFALKFHHEQRDLSVYNLTVLKSGPKLKLNTSDPDGLPDQTGGGGQNTMTMRYTNNSMDELAHGLGYFVDRPVIDQTHLPGKFDFRLDWTPDTSLPTEVSAAPGLFTAIQEQLGLKLEAVKGPADILVIDHIEHPSAN